MKPTKIDGILFVSFFILCLVAAVIYAVLFQASAGEQLKTIVVQSVLLALAAVTGYFLNSSADQAKKDAPPDAPATTTTTVTTGVPADVPPVPLVPPVATEEPKP